MTIQEPARPQSAPRAKANRKPVNIALQGGGAHGAFGWGVLDKILEDGRLDIEAFADQRRAMNAVVIFTAYRWRPGAREPLNEFWTESPTASSTVRGTPLGEMAAGLRFSGARRPYHAFQALTHQPRLIS
jgi:NTE family protein